MYILKALYLGIVEGFLFSTRFLWELKKLMQINIMSEMDYI